MRTFAVGAVLAVGLLGGSLSGCGGTPDAGPPPSPSTTAPSASPSPTAPVMPDAARANTKAGAVAFVKFYIATFNHAQATGDVSTLKSLGAKGCVSCEALVRAIQSTYRRGGRAEGGRWIVTGAHGMRSLGHAWEVDVAGRFERSRVFYSSSDAQGQPAKGGPALTSFYLNGQDGGWKVKRWTRVDLG